MCLAKTTTLHKNQLKIALSWNQGHAAGNAAAKLRAVETIIKMKTKTSGFPPIIKTYYFCSNQHFPVGTKNDQWDGMATEISGQQV